MTKAEEIYHRFVQYEWNEIGEGMKKSILDAINEALRQPPVSGSLPLFKCKCGYETSNSVAWCVHADCCNGNDR